MICCDPPGVHGSPATLLVEVVREPSPLAGVLGSELARSRYGCRKRFSFSQQYCSFRSKE